MNWSLFQLGFFVWYAVFVFGNAPPDDPTGDGPAWMEIPAGVLAGIALSALVVYPAVSAGLRIGRRFTRLTALLSTVAAVFMLCLTWIGTAAAFQGGRASSVFAGVVVLFALTVTPAPPHTWRVCLFAYCGDHGALPANRVAALLDVVSGRLHPDDVAFGRAAVEGGNAALCLGLIIDAARGRIALSDTERAELLPLAQMHNARVHSRARRAVERADSRSAER